MIQWYIAVKNLLRNIEQKSRDAIPLCEQGNDQGTATLSGYITADYNQLESLWAEKYPEETLGNLGLNIQSDTYNAYYDIIYTDLRELEERADVHLQNASNFEGEYKNHGFEYLLHPVIFENAYHLYRNGHLRESVLNSITAVFDYMRARTGCEEDGAQLVGKIMSQQNPILIMSEVDTESGKSDQKGFMQIFSGSFQGIRNPKAHSLTHDLTEDKAAQYLVYSSLLARRIEEATIITS